MPIKRRLSKARETQITVEAIELFARGLRLLKRPESEENERDLRDVSGQLDRAIGMRPWQYPILDTVGADAPPEFMDTQSELADWYRSTSIRAKLQQALQARRRAERLSA